MNKELAHETWRCLLKLATHGKGAQSLDNPLFDFSASAKSGAYMLMDVDNFKYSSVWVEPCMRTYLAEHPEYNTVAALTEALATAREEGDGACAPIVQKLLDEAIAAGK